MATTLAPVDSREVLRCDHCNLVQFRGGSNACRRCHVSLDEIIIIADAVQLELPEPMLSSSHSDAPHLQLAAQIRRFRVRNGLSQRQLALRMSVPRTYVSKIENQKATPTLHSLERLARALEVTLPDLLGGNRMHDEEASSHAEELGALMEDAFIEEMIPFVHQLTGMQMTSIIGQLREMATRTHRSS